MTELEEKIKSYADAYYVNGTSDISDEEFDALIEELKRTNPGSELLKGPAGSDIVGVDKRYKLPHCMNTFAKTHNEEEFIHWWNTHKSDDVVVSLKIDGNGILIRYTDGELKFIYSRGDTESGLDLTHIAGKVKGIVPFIKGFNGCIRGEVFMRKSVFEANFKGQKNPRNMCAGILGRKDGTDLEYLNFIAYEVYDDKHELDKTELGKLNWLKEIGFEVPHWISGCYLEDIIEWRNSLDINGEIPCDGIVIKKNIVDYEDIEKKIPSNAIAFKPASQVAITTVKDIKWQLQGGIFSPVAIFNPVELDGTTVERATLHNLNKMEEFDIRIGSIIEVIKSGMIIPKVVRVIK